MANRRKRCVIADDVRASQLILKTWMEELDFDCTVVPDGQEAEVILREEGADLVITDIEMPRMNGLQLLRSVRNDKESTISEVPVIVVSSLQDSHLDAVVEEMGGTGFFGKPLNKEVLRSAVERIEAGCRNLRDLTIRRAGRRRNSSISSTLQRLANDAQLKMKQDQ